MRVYKIRHRLTGLFSEGGLIPEWNNHGKMWRTPGYAKAAITNTVKQFSLRLITAPNTSVRAEITDALLDVSNWEIVSFILEEKDAEIVDYRDHIKENSWLAKELKAKGISVT